MRAAHLAVLLPFVFLAACGGPLPAAPDPTVAPPVVAAPPAATPSAAPSATLVPPPPAPEDDRSDADKALDPGRHPTEMIAFFGIKPGQHVAELGSGSGYTTELLARAVGPNGIVYGQNPKWLLEKFAEKPWSARLSKPAMANVTRLDREFDDPFPADVKDLDAVISILFYHDTVWLKVDRDKMNRAAFAALKHGGIYGIIDHSAQPGSGVRDVKTFHRIDEDFVKAEVLRAGFKLADEANFLRNPADTRDWNDSPGAAAEKRGTSDRFVLKFVKP
jgi:predicted methyltransferase